ncbi:MAG: CoA transferase [bacterium]
MTAPLDGVKVLDLSQFLSGPRCTQILADMGAEVIKVEPPEGETMRILSMVMAGAEKSMSIINRNKKGITLNLKKEKGVELLKGLVKHADVLVENFLPGTMEKFGAGYEVLRGINPGLIYAAITGFGQTGPLSFKGAFDIIAQATGGIMAAYKIPDKPPGTFFGDLVSGAYCAVGIMGALMVREKTGEGQMIDISMQDVMYFHNYPAMSYAAIGAEREEMLKKLGKTKEEVKAIRERGVIFWNSYRAKDGYVAVVALTEGQWKRFVETIGRPDILDNPKFSNVMTRMLHSDEVRHIVEEWSGERTMDEVVEILDRARVPAGQVREAEQLVDDPQLRARGMYCEVEHPKYGKIGVPGVPIKMSGTPGEVHCAHPVLGEHNQEIYGGWTGCTPEQIKQLKKERVI